MVDDWYGNTAIVTAVTGGYDHPQESIITKGVDHIMYTDGTAMPMPGWEIMELSNPFGMNPRRLSKAPKMNPHGFPVLCEYKYVIWIDGSIIVKNTKFVPEILSYLDKGFVVSPHFETTRHCAYEEAAVSMTLPKYQHEPLQEQVDHYRSEGFPENHGLYECGVAARKMDTPGLAEVGKLWLEENVRWSYQDQVSFPYVLWKTQFQPDRLPHSFRDFDWVTVRAHLKGDLV